MQNGQSDASCPVRVLLVEKSPGQGNNLLSIVGAVEVDEPLGPGGGEAEEEKDGQVSLIHNERTKLTATLMNRVAAAVFIAAVLVPLVALSYDLPGPNKCVAAAVVSLI
jgi:hypothetical protein